MLIIKHAFKKIIFDKIAPGRKQVMHSHYSAAYLFIHLVTQSCKYEQTVYAVL